MTNRPHTCPTCKQPWHTLAPIGAPAAIDLRAPEIDPAEVQRASGATFDKPAPPPPQNPAGFVDLFTIHEQQQRRPPLTRELPQIPQPPAQFAQQELAPLGRFEGNTHTPVAPLDVFNHPIIGGKVTICVCVYGNYPDLHRRCLSSLITTTPPDHRDIHVVGNEVCPETVAFLSNLRDHGKVQKVILNPDNRKKYPAMRQLFHDPNDPIKTNWVIWFDDDSIANRDSKWLPKLLDTIIAHYPAGDRLFGAEMFTTLSSSQIAWVKSRPWYRGRDLQTRPKQGAPNGNRAWFAAGGFWALHMDVIRQQDIPDPQIGHNGGDYMVGAQVWQAGYTVKGWNNKKQFVFTSSVKRRGLEEEHTGTANWKPGGVPKAKKR